MTDDERDIRSFLEAEAQHAPHPTAITAATVRAARLKRAGLVASSVFGIAIFVAGITFGAAAVRDDATNIAPANPNQTPTPEPTSTRHSNEALGLAITTPPTWTIEWSGETQSTALFGATFAFDKSGGFCSPLGPLTILPSDGAFFWMYEFELPAAPPRPEHFALDEQSLASYETTGCRASYRIDLSDKGRTFSIHVAFGSDAEVALRDEVLRVLDSLEVRPGSPEQPPPCDDDGTYGQSIPGRWLEDAIVRLGAPGGYEVTSKEVRDTGTALWMDIPEYDNDPTIYATMLTPGDDPNIASSPPEEEVGQRGDYTLYLQRGNPWESYKAVSQDWQLSLIAYPGVDNDEVSWPEHTLQWLKDATDIAIQSPPECSGPLN